MKRHTKKKVANFDENVLLQIYRNYSLDESVAYLKSQLEMKETELSNLKFRIGEMKSEISELKDEKEKLKRSITELNRPEMIESKKRLRKQFLQDEYVKELKTANESLVKKVGDLSKEVTKWRNNFFQLQLKLDSSKSPAI